MCEEGLASSSERERERGRGESELRWRLDSGFLQFGGLIEVQVFRLRVEVQVFRLSVQICSCIISKISYLYIYIEFFFLFRND